MAVNRLMKPDAVFQQHVIKIISRKLSRQDTNLEERSIIKRFRHVSVHFLPALLSIIQGDSKRWTQFRTSIFP